MAQSSLDELRFTVPGEPVGKGRARTVSRKRRNKTTGALETYQATITPEKTEQYELSVKRAARLAIDSRPVMSGPVMLELRIFVSVAASWSRKRREMALAGEIYPTKKPDVSNIQKAVEDAMNGVTYVDDTQITDVHIRKRFSDTPRVEVIITPLAKLASN